MESLRHQGRNSGGESPFSSFGLIYQFNLDPQLPHRPVSTIPRGGGTSADHVDILGSSALNEIILKVATGIGDEVQDGFVSDIREYAKRVRWD